MKSSPRVTMAEGLAQLLGWYRAQGVAPDRLLEREIVHNWDSVRQEPTR